MFTGITFNFTDEDIWGKPVLHLLTYIDTN